MGVFKDIWLKEHSKQKLLHKLKTGIKVRRGVKPHKFGLPFSTDPGDFGRGVYYSTNWQRARVYADKEENVQKTIIKFNNPLILTKAEAYNLAGKFHTVRLPQEFYLSILDHPDRRQLATNEQLKNAQKMTDYFVSMGHDGIAVVGTNEIEIVDFRK